MTYSATELLKIPFTNLLTGEILYFYRHVIMEDKPMFGGKPYLPFIEAHDLLNIREGWESPEPELAWRDNHMIFADRDGDMLFCDTSDEKSPVYSALHGYGKEEYRFRLTDSLSDFFSI